MQIFINPQVFDDLTDIKSYISYDSEIQAQKVVSEILRAVETLADFPQSGALLSNKVRCDKKYRYLIRHSYAIVYKQEKDSVVVVTVLHLKRDFSHIDFNRNRASSTILSGIFVGKTG